MIRYSVLTILYYLCDSIHLLISIAQSVNTTFDQGQLLRSFTIRYLIIDANTSYFALISKKALNEQGAIVSTPHLKIKFPTLIMTIKADQKQVRQCYVESLKATPY